MAYDLDEQEQIDQLRAWWAKFGSSALTVLVLALVVVAGWRGWQWYEGNQSTQARGYFEALEEAARQQDGPESIARIDAAMKTLRENYSSTDYAVRGALVAAAALQARNETKAAEAQLQWVIQSGHQALVPVAKLRLAGLLLDGKAYEQALAQVQDAPEAFSSLFADRQGDIYAAQGQTEQARKAWNKALEVLGASSALTPLIKLKLGALGA
jgi:predicted negative regulator of RcsB-dependent stress response